MQTLPNSLVVFNATPHPITFWCADWAEPINVPTDEIVNAVPKEMFIGTIYPRETLRHEDYHENHADVRHVRTEFVGNDAGRATIARAKAAGAEVIVGSIIAAQAYPGDVVAMTPAPGFERVPPAKKRMNPDKFISFLVSLRPAGLNPGALQ